MQNTESNEKLALLALADLGIAYTRREHPPVYTVAEARQYDREGSETHAKNLFLRNRKGDRYYLLIVEEARAVNLKALAKRLGEGALGLASPARLMEKLGLEPGAVGPFGLLNDANHDVVVLLDDGLACAEATGFHPNVNTVTLMISGQDLVKFLRHQGNRIELIQF